MCLLLAFCCEFEAWLMYFDRERAAAMYSSLPYALAAGYACGAMLLIGICLMFLSWLQFLLYLIKDPGRNWKYALLSSHCSKEAFRHHFMSIYPEHSLRLYLWSIESAAVQNCGVQKGFDNIKDSWAFAAFAGRHPRFECLRWHVLSCRAVELPYLLSQTVIFVPIAYWLIDFQHSAAKFFFYFLTFFLSLSMFTFFGQLLVFLTPSQGVAQIFGAGKDSDIQPQDLFSICGAAPLISSPHEQMRMHQHVSSRLQFPMWKWIVIHLFRVKIWCGKV